MNPEFASTVVLYAKLKSHYRALSGDVPVSDKPLYRDFLAGLRSQCPQYDTSFIASGPKKTESGSDRCDVTLSRRCHIL